MIKGKIRHAYLSVTLIVALLFCISTDATGRSTIYIDTDRETYMSGESIRFSVWSFDSSLSIDTSQFPVKVFLVNKNHEILDQIAFEKSKLPIKRKLDIPSEYADPIAWLVSAYQLSNGEIITSQKAIRINGKNFPMEQKPILTLHLEGENRAVAGISQRIVIKGRTEFNRVLAGEVKLYDENSGDSWLAEFDELGLADFMILPYPGQMLKASWGDHSESFIVEVQKEGARLMLWNSDSTGFDLRLLKSKNYEKDLVMNIISPNKKTIIRNLNSSPLTKIFIPVSELSQGVNRVEITSLENEILSSNLLYVKGRKEHHIESLQKSISPRSLIKILPSELGIETGVYSVSAHDSKFSSSDIQSYDMMDFLYKLIPSHSDDTDLVFADQNLSFAIDKLMITKNQMKMEIYSSEKNIFHHHFEIPNRFRNNENIKYRASVLQSGQMTIVDNLLTPDQTTLGIPYFLGDNYVIRFEYKKGQSEWKQFEPQPIDIQSDVFRKVRLVFPFTPREVPPSEENKTVFEGEIVESTLDYGIVLDEIEIEGMRKSILSSSRSRLGDPDATVVFDQSSSTVGDFRLALAGRIGGVTLRSIPGNPLPQLMIRGGTNHLVFIDGLQFMGDQDDLASAINSTEIDRIDIYKTLAKIAMISAFGTGTGGGGVGPSSSGGVISIYTKSPFQKSVKLDNNYIANGFSEYEIKDDIDYSDEKRNRNTQDNRISLLYNPFVNTFKGNPEIEFYTSDQVNEINFTIEGFTKDGDFVHKNILIVDND